MQSADLFRSFNPSLMHCPNHRRRRHLSSIPSLPFRHSPIIRRLGNHGLLRLRLNPNSPVYAQNGFYGRELEIVVNEFEETGCSDLPVELCLTRNLDPALTLRHAVDAMKVAVNKLKLDPPCSRSGVLRFQIAVPPSVKSLNWSYSQSTLSDPFPQFYLATKTMHEKFNGLVITPQMLGVSGVGAAITFRGSSDVLRGYKLMERYLSLESPLLRTYGFTGIDWNMRSNEMYNHPDSFYFFIPQIEMVEFENISFLASNLVWDNSLSYTLNEAVHSLERSLHQINLHVSSASTHDIDMWSCFKGLSDIKEKEDFKMVHMNAETLVNMLAKGRFPSLEESAISDKSYYRHSSTVFFSKNMVYNNISNYLELHGVQVETHLGGRILLWTLCLSIVVGFVPGYRVVFYHCIITCYLFLIIFY